MKRYFYCWLALLVLSTSVQAELTGEDPVNDLGLTYQGRQIAKTMSYHGAWWLMRDTREQEEHVSSLLELLGALPHATMQCNVPQHDQQ